MEKSAATQAAIEIVKVWIQSAGVHAQPSTELAEDTADFIEALSDRLQKIDEA